MGGRLPTDLDRFKVGRRTAALLVLLAGVIFLRGLDLTAGGPSRDGRISLPLNTVPAKEALVPIRVTVIHYRQLSHVKIQVTSSSFGVLLIENTPHPRSGRDLGYCVGRLGGGGTRKLKDGSE